MTHKLIENYLRNVLGMCEKLTLDFFLGSSSMSLQHKNLKNVIPQFVVGEVY